MKTTLALVLAVTLVTAGAKACPCSGTSVGTAFLTTPSQSHAGAIIATTRVAIGAFDAQGAFRRLAEQQNETAQELVLRGALRAPEEVEWQLELGAARYRLASAGFAVDDLGIGDLMGRVRYTLRREDMPHSSPRLPGLSITGLLRAPLAAIANAGSNGLGTAGAQLGLGSWELGLGLEAQRMVAETFELWLSTEVAYRLPDEVLGRRRQLGPRWSFAVGGTREWAGWLGATVAVTSRMTGEAALSGKRLDGTAERLLSVVVSLSAFEAGGFRSIVGWSIDPPLQGLSRNVAATTALSLSLSAAR